jgi:hypothetical protein
MQLVAPSAVTMAVATDAMICTINFKVSFLLITFNVLIVSLVRLPKQAFLHSYIFEFWNWAGA